MDVISGRPQDISLERPQDISLERPQNVRLGRPRDGQIESLGDVLGMLERRPWDVLGTSICRLEQKPMRLSPIHTRFS